LDPAYDGTLAIVAANVVVVVVLVVVILLVVRKWISRKTTIHDGEEWRIPRLPTLGNSPSPRSSVVADDPSPSRPCIVVLVLLAVVISTAGNCNWF
jgi:hypothetical protein